MVWKLNADKILIRFNNYQEEADLEEVKERIFAIARKYGLKEFVVKVNGVAVEPDFNEFKAGDTVEIEEYNEMA